MLVDNNRTTETDKRVDGDVEGVAFSSYLCVRLVAKSKRFSNVDFKYTIFDSCYFRKCVFDSCDFTGCRFVGTNLVGSSFTGCKFDYASFERTQVENEILDTQCPAYENLKIRFARSLRVNYQQIGDSISANKAIEVELAATEIHLHKAWSSNESYYRKKYNGVGRIRVYFQWLNFKVLDFVWGNGESTLKLVRSLVYAFVAMTIIDVSLYRDTTQVSSYFSALAETPQIFLGTIVPAHYAKPYLTIISLLRLISFGFFMSIIIKRFNRR